MAAMTEMSINVPDAFDDMVTNEGNQLKTLSFESPVLLVFLRHFGCAFCRASLIELAEKRESYTDMGVKIVFVHMSDYDTAEEYFERYNLKGAEHISDPECEYYQSFGIVKGNLNQLFGLSSLMKGFSYTFKKGHGWGRIIGDGFQMPGVFLINQGAIKDSFIYKTVSDEPDYDRLVACCQTD